MSGPQPLLPRVEALDGLRGLAVLAVVVYHARPGWLPAGFLGVDVFFVLSGYLITTLLLAEHERSGRIDLRRFWARRFRRLMPPLLVLVVVLAMHAAWFGDAADRVDLRADGLATLGYVANWWFIASADVYAQAFGTPSPLQHAWSLAIEEQFYVVWPLLVVALAWRARSDRARLRWAVLAVALIGAAASIVAMALLHDPLRDPSRVYFGTDTRVHGLLAGVALAALLQRRDRRRANKHVVIGAAAIALSLLAVAMVSLDHHSPALYRGGFAGLAIATAVVIAGASQEGRNPLRRALEWRPLVALGLVSYGVYLWHWPALVLLDEHRTGLDGPALLALQAAVTAVMTAVSWYVVEQPVRHGAVPGWVRVPLAPVAVVLAVVILAGATGAPETVAGEPEAQRASLVIAPVAAASAASTIPVEAPGPMRVLMVGDSVAWTLGGGRFDFPQPKDYVSPFPADEVTLRNEGVYACELLPGNSRIDGRERAPSGTCPQWRERWATAVHELDPDIVVLPPTMWDTYDHKIAGEWIEFGTPAADHEWWGVLTEVRDIVTAGGARLVLLSSPILDNEQEPNTRREEGWRVQHMSATAQRFAAAHPATTAYIDLASFVCPDVECVDLFVMRPDGIHYDQPAARRVAEWLLPQFERLLGR